MTNQDNTYATEIRSASANSEGSEELPVGCAVREQSLGKVRHSRSEASKEALELGNQSLSAQMQARNDGWTEQQENRLFQLHNIHGNRWAKISHYLPGKTDNCIKNHFYCTLRKAFRRVNRYISENKSKIRQKEIKNIVLSKIISVAEQRFETKLDVNEAMILSCCNIKNNLIRFAKDGSISETVEADLIGLIFEINEFSRNFKKRKAKKPKKAAGTSLEAEVMAQRANYPPVQPIPTPTQTVREAPLLRRLDDARSLEFNGEEFGEIGGNGDSPFFNFNQGSPPHLLNYELNSPNEEFGQADNPFSIIASYGLGLLQGQGPEQTGHVDFRSEPH